MHHVLEQLLRGTKFRLYLQPAGKRCIALPMADGGASAHEPSSSTRPGSNEPDNIEFTNDQIIQLETIYCRDQYRADESAMQEIMDMLSASRTDFSDISAASIEAWFRHRAAEGQRPTAVAVQNSQHAAAQIAAQQRRREVYLSHDSKKFVRQKQALFETMERFHIDNPGANVLLLITSPGSLRLWADGRGPYMNADSVLRNAAESVGAVLKDASEQSQQGTLDWQEHPGQRHKRNTAHKGGGYMIFQSEYRETAREELLSAGVALSKGVVERKCAEVWKAMSSDEREIYHGLLRRRDEQQGTHAAAATAGEASSLLLCLHSLPCLPPLEYMRPSRGGENSWQPCTRSGKHS